MEFANEEDKKRIEAKNERRRDSLDAFRSEVKDEYRAQQENGIE
jgi:small acid-soluble spore protein (thioredoxin-like protein)